MCDNIAQMAQRFKNEVAAQALGHRVRAAREKAGLTVNEVAKKAGVHHSSVSRTERGRFPTMNPSVRKICTFFRIEPEMGIRDAEGLLFRLQWLSAHEPDVVHALEYLLEALEARRAGSGPMQ